MCTQAIKLQIIKYNRKSGNNNQMIGDGRGQQKQEHENKVSDTKQFMEAVNEMIGFVHSLENTIDCQ